VRDAAVVDSPLQFWSVIKPRRLDEPLFRTVRPNCRRWGRPS